MPPKKQHATKHNFPKKENESPATAAASSASTFGGLTNYAAQQGEELESLAAIYIEDFEQVEGKAAAWSKSPDIAFNVRIKAPSDPKIAVTLCVQFPATYPKTIPILKLQDLQSGNPSVSPRLQNVIKTRPNDLLGSLMIYDIVESLRDILEDAACQKANNEGLDSLEEERAAREASLERRTREREQELRRQQEDKLAEEDQMLAEQVDMERRRQEKERLSVRPLNQEHDTLQSLSQTSSTFEQMITTFDQPMATKDAKGRDTIIFRSVWGRFIILKSRDKMITIVSPVTHKDVMVPQLLLKDIYLVEKSSESTKFRREIQVIEELLESSKVHRHANVVDLLGYKVQRTPVNAGHTSDSAATWELSILSEYANKGSLQELLELSGGLDAKKVRSWTRQILDALEFFDQNGYVHPAVHAGNVLLFRSQTGEVKVKLSDGYGTALKTLVMQAKEQAGIAARERPYWTAPELLGKFPQRTSKTCIWDLGVLVLQMVFGPDVAERQYLSPEQCINGTDMSDALEELVRKVLQTEPSRRPRAFDLTSFAFFQKKEEQLLHSGSPIVPSTPYRRTRQSSSSALQTISNFVISRFENEFEYVGKLGKGGFGEVVKARNRMDGQFYAIKKIVCASNEALAVMLSETKLLSRLNHPYVVRYYGAWDEKEQLPGGETSSTASHEAVASFDDDPFAVSSLGHDFMSSSNYRNIGIQFGDSDEEVGEESAQDAPESPQEQASKRFSADEEASINEAVDSQPQPQPLASRISRFWQARPEKTTLYIQMEYCENHTLRHLIKDDLHEDKDKGWRLFRQILDGLAHIHANGIVHRDLKPDNIFITKDGYARIGDFGLATTGLVTTAARGSDGLVAGPETRSIGTTYYVAPELGSKGSGKYSSKVDMYSLGIILFEMCHPLKTSMQRDRELSLLREKDPTLPATFENPELAVQGLMVLRLLNHNQDERPSAAELLEAEQVSEPLEQARIERYLDTVSESNLGAYTKAISSFFSRPMKRAQDLAWNDNTQGPASLAASLLAMSVKEIVSSVFRRHGAVENDRQTILPRTDHYTGLDINPATFLDRSGMVVLLPYDLTMPFARSLGSTKLEYEKVFSIGEVFRSSTSGLEPIGYPEIDFDIISYNTVDLPLKEAEVIKVLDEIIQEFPTLRSKPMSINLNHSDLLDIILDYCCIKPAQYPKVKAVLINLNVGGNNWTRVRTELRSDAINVPATSLDDLARFNFRDNLDGASRKLEAFFEGTMHAGRLAQILARIETVTTFLTRFNVKCKVYISPLSTDGEKIYRGSLLIQCMNESQKKILAAGGRYDSLIAEYQPRGIAAQVRAVGFRLNLSELVLAVRSEAKKPGSAKFLKSAATDPPALTHRRCEVLLTSPDGNILRDTGVELVTNLWANGISAELTGSFVSMEELEAAYHHDAYAFVVNIRYDNGAIGERSIKVRNVSKKEDTDILATDLVNWLKGEIRQRKHQEGTTPHVGMKLKRETSTNEALSLIGESRDVDVRVLSSQHRGKKTNRRQIIDVAAVRTRELVGSMLSDAPIVAIETSDEIIDSMRNTRLSDPESWRNLTQSAPLQERKYLQQVQEMLQEIAVEGKRGAFVFNHRTRTCIYYDVGKVN